MLIECLILSVRERHEIRVRFTTNGVELKHCLQKKMITKDEVPKQNCGNFKGLKPWIQSYYSEIRRAMLHYVEPVMWVQLSKERRSRKQFWSNFTQYFTSTWIFKPKICWSKARQLWKEQTKSKAAWAWIIYQKSRYQRYVWKQFYTITNKEKTTGNSKSVE